MNEDRLLQDLFESARTEAPKRSYEEIVNNFLPSVQMSYWELIKNWWQQLSFNTIFSTLLIGTIAISAIVFQYNEKEEIIESIDIRLEQDPTSLDSKISFSPLSQSKTRYGYRVQKGKKGFSRPKYLRSKPQGFLYTKPLVLLVSDATFSAAEEFVLVLSKSPHVTIIGTSTGGYFSDVFNYRLPNGMNVWLSHQQYYNVDSLLLEDYGIVPDIRLENKIEHLAEEIDPPLEKAIEILKK